MFCQLFHSLCIFLLCVFSHFIITCALIKQNWRILEHATFFVQYMKRSLAETQASKHRGKKWYAPCVESPSDWVFFEIPLFLCFNFDILSAKTDWVWSNLDQSPCRKMMLPVQETIFAKFDFFVKNKQAASVIANAKAEWNTGHILVLFTLRS